MVYLGKFVKGKAVSCSKTNSNLNIALNYRLEAYLHQDQTLG